MVKQAFEELGLGAKIARLVRPSARSSFLCFCAVPAWYVGHLTLYLFFLGFVFMYVHLDVKTDDSLSAYSVFNPNFESIDGTLSRAQVDPTRLGSDDVPRGVRHISTTTIKSNEREKANLEDVRERRIAAFT